MPSFNNSKQRQQLPLNPVQPHLSRALMEVLCLPLLATLYFAGCGGPQGEPVCTITGCGWAYGFPGLYSYQVWACNEETGLAWTQGLASCEWFPCQPSAEELQCGQAVLDLVSPYYTLGYAVGEGCADLGVPAERISDGESDQEEDAFCGDIDFGAGDDDDSGR